MSSMGKAAFWNGCAAGVFTAMMLVPAGVRAQANGANVTDQDKQFLTDFGKDSNFEIATSQLALSKSPSADVKRYATMVSHDHKALKVQIAAAGKAAGVPAVGPDAMTDDEQAMYDKLKGLSGKEFDQAYIQELVKGNDQIEQEEKSEASDRKVPAVKRVAVSGAAADKKHAVAAKALAKAHGVNP